MRAIGLYNCKTNSAKMLRICKMIILAVATYSSQRIPAKTEMQNGSESLKKSILIVAQMLHIIEKNLDKEITRLDNLEQLKCVMFKKMAKRLIHRAEEHAMFDYFNNTKFIETRKRMDGKMVYKSCTE